jgi:hypothetical protein
MILDIIDIFLPNVHNAVQIFLVCLATTDLHFVRAEGVAIGKAANSIVKLAALYTDYAALTHINQRCQNNRCSENSGQRPAFSR